MPDLFFYLFAGVMVLAALGVVLARNPLYNVLCLVLAIFALSSIFVLLKAYFVGMILLLVYAGAVLVFFLFVVMCLNLNTITLNTAQQSRFQLLGALTAGAFFAHFFLWARAFLALPAPASSVPGTIEAIGKVLFTEYLLPFELTSLLLLIALFGIVSLAQGALSTGKEEGKS